MKHWKILGLAGIAGVAATGAVVVRAERNRRAYSPDDVRARLHARHEALAAAVLTAPEPPAPPTPTTLPDRLRAALVELRRRVPLPRG